jgi:hypothetical protein
MVFGQLSLTDTYYHLDSSQTIVIVNEADTVIGDFTNVKLPTFQFSQYEKRTYSRENQKIPKKVGQRSTPIEILVDYNLKFQGEFINGERSGLWKYWNARTDPNYKINSIYSSNWVYYYGDSTVYEDYSNSIEQRIVYNSDNSSIKGSFFFMRQYKVKMICEDSSCTFYNESKVISKSNISDWRDTIYEMEYQYYSSKMNRKL